RRTQLPAVTQTKVDRFDVFFFQIRLAEIGLELAVEKRNGPRVVAVESNIPHVLIQVAERNTGIILQKHFSAVEDEVPYHREVVPVQEIRRRFDVSYRRFFGADVIKEEGFLFNSRIADVERQVGDHTVHRLAGAAEDDADTGNTANKVGIEF